MLHEHSLQRCRPSFHLPLYIGRRLGHKFGSFQRSLDWHLDANAIGPGSILLDAAVYSDAIGAHRLHFSNVGKKNSRHALARRVLVRHSFCPPHEALRHLTTTFGYYILNLRDRAKHGYRAKSVGCAA